MDNVKEAIENRGSTLKEIEHSALFLDRKAWRNFVTDRPTSSAVQALLVLLLQLHYQQFS